jgi:predicted HicB family RNase H-like nuclease
MEKKLTIRVTESDHQRLKGFAKAKEMSMAGAIRLLIDKIK